MPHGDKQFFDYPAYLHDTLDRERESLSKDRLLLMTEAHTLTHLLGRLKESDG
jgi:hypothetical protein